MWSEATLKQLQERDLEHLDWDHLIEEIERLGNEQKHKLESYLLQLLKHLLLYQHWSLPECKNHWEVEIDNYRVEFRKLTKSKNLYNYVLTVNHVMLIILTSRNLLLVVLFAWAMVAVVQLYRTPHAMDYDDEDAEPTSWPLTEEKQLS